jgi:hypothetical protein
MMLAGIINRRDPLPLDIKNLRKDVSFTDLVEGIPAG